MSDRVRIVWLLLDILVTFVILIGLKFSAILLFILGISFGLLARPLLDKAEGEP
jgi:hypothetical protein